MKGKLLTAVGLVTGIFAARAQPFTGLTTRFLALPGHTPVTLTDIVREMLQKTVTTGAAMQIDLSWLPSGIYLAEHTLRNKEDRPELITLCSSYHFIQHAQVG